MFPLFRPNDEIIISTLSEAIELGDILFYLDKGEYIAHRVVADNGHFYTKGDRSLLRENFHGKKNIRKVLGYRRLGRTLLWGKRGQPYKKILAFLSSYNRHNNPRLFRWPVIILLNFFNFLSHIYLFLKSLWITHKKS